MPHDSAQLISTWAENRALLRSYPSDVPRAKTEDRAILRATGFTTFGIGTHAKNLRGTMPQSFDTMSNLNSLTPTEPNSISR